MSQRAHKRRWQQTLVWAWLLLIAFVPQLVMRATHFHHTLTCAVQATESTATSGHHHVTKATDKSATTTAQGASTVLHQAESSTQGQDCGDDCLLCHAPTFVGVTVQPFVLTYYTLSFAKHIAWPLPADVRCGVVTTLGLRGPPMA